MDLFNYVRRTTTDVRIGDTPLGSRYPIRLQSMTNTDTRDTEACVAQAKRIVDNGGDYVRLTTQGASEAENLMNINARLRSDGYMTPLIADVHFNPAVADIAARYAEGVRINPGNYADTPEAIAANFLPLLQLCKDNHTALRIGVNHGSLSERITGLYGDTPEGMVESCMEFLRLCVEAQFADVVVSIKASNTVVMVRTVRLLVATMEREGMAFPLHLGVTEAGDGEDGRIKSALGIGALLADGLGDTIRVSLSEPPEAEIPVARILRDYIGARAYHPYIYAEAAPDFCYTAPLQRATTAVANIGGTNRPIVIASRLGGETSFPTDAPLPDYIYSGRALPTTLAEGGRYILDADVWDGAPNTYPAFTTRQMALIATVKAPIKFLFVPLALLGTEVVAGLRAMPEVVVVAQSNHVNRVGEHRAIAHRLMQEKLTNPLVVFQYYAESDLETLQIKAAADTGPLLFDGLCNGVMLFNHAHDITVQAQEATAFAILQGARARITKTEYIACPSCGRTQFDLQATLARVKAATAHCVGLKIAVMGCIVNGPGEMADADYGYVGGARGKVSLYRGKTCVEKNIPESEAVERLLQLIRN